VAGGPLDWVTVGGPATVWVTLLWPVIGWAGVAVVGGVELACVVTNDVTGAAVGRSAGSRTTDGSRSATTASGADGASADGSP